MAHHAEGRVVNTGGKNPSLSDWEYQYHLRDHLGNNRITFRDDGTGQAEMIQEHHPYPFGLQQKGMFTDNSTNRYKYNGKEFTDDFGLDWYDYGFRNYRPDFCRFTSPDPISDQFPHVSTFNYAENEPVNSVDLHGLQKVGAPALNYMLEGFRRMFQAATKSVDNTKAKASGSVRYTVSQEKYNSGATTFSQENRVDATVSVKAETNLSKYLDSGNYTNNEYVEPTNKPLVDVSVDSKTEVKQVTCAEVCVGGATFKVENTFSVEPTNAQEYTNTQKVKAGYSAGKTAKAYAGGYKSTNSKNVNQTGVEVSLTIPVSSSTKLKGEVKLYHENQD